MRFVDLSHTITDQTITYKGLPAPIICDYLSRKESESHYDVGTTFQIGSIEMVGNTGTYLDAPFHRYEDGKDLSELFLSDVAELNGVCIRIPDHVQKIDQHYFHNRDLKNKAVIVHTGWSKHWNKDAYFEGHPFLTRDAAQYLLEQGVKLVGIDSHNIDDTGDGSRPVHSILLGANILIVEHLCQLHLVPDEDFFFSAVPVKVKGMGTMPVRAYAKFEVKHATGNSK